VSGKTVAIEVVMNKLNVLDVGGGVVLLLSIFFFNYHTASNVSRPLTMVVTPRYIANDLLRDFMIKTLIDFFMWAGTCTKYF